MVSVGLAFSSSLATKPQIFTIQPVTEKFAKSYFRLVLFDTVVSSLTVRGYLNMNVHSVK